MNSFFWVLLLKVETAKLRATPYPKYDTKLLQ